MMVDPKMVELFTMLYSSPLYPNDQPTQGPGFYKVVDEMEKQGKWVLGILLVLMPYC